MIPQHTKVNNIPKAKKLADRGTPYSIYRRILDHLYEDLRNKRITAIFLIEVSRELKKILHDN